MAETHREGRLGFEDTLNFTNTLCIAYTLCSAILRSWIRRGIYGIDDLIIAAATFSTLGFFAANYVALEHSAGKPWHYIEAAHDVASFNRVRPFHTRCNQAMKFLLTGTSRHRLHRFLRSQSRYICPRVVLSPFYYVLQKTVVRSGSIAYALHAWP